MSEWTKIEKEFPDSYTDVLCLLEEGRMEVCSTTGHLAFFNNDGAQCNVTHWMPLPEPPK